MTQQSSKRTGVITTENSDSQEVFYLCPAAILYYFIFRSPFRPFGTEKQT